MKIQPFVMAVAVMLTVAAIWSAVHGEWKMAATSLCLGLANAVFSTIR